MKIRFCSTNVSANKHTNYTDWLLTAETPEDGFALRTLHHKDRNYTCLTSESPPTVRLRFAHYSEAYGVGGASFSLGNFSGPATSVEHHSSDDESDQPTESTASSSTSARPDDDRVVTDRDWKLISNLDNQIAIKPPAARPPSNVKHVLFFRDGSVYLRSDVKSKTGEFLGQGEYMLLYKPTRGEVRALLSGMKQEMAE